MLKSASSSTPHAAASHYGRAPAYRRIASLSSRPVHQLSSPHSSLNIRLHSPFLPSPLRQPESLLLRSLHTSASRWQEQKQQDDAKSKASSGDESSAKDESQQESKEESKDESKDESREEGDKDKKDEKKEEAPPPPHGDKSPWQVFTETLSSEFKASKEWNESTKALGSAAHDFTQNPAVQSMRRNYESASGAASSTTSKVLKNTGKAVGQSAAWTWDTAPMRGMRAGANAMGRGLEKGTRPLRETEAYKSMANVIDDGSSSRYGGWTEREERKRQRETRAAEEYKRTGRTQRVENLEEDPE